MRILKVILCVLLLSFLFVQCADVKSVDSLQFLKTNVNNLSVKVDGKLVTSAWRINTKLKPDVFTSNKVGKRVTFCSDIDSISCVLAKNTEFNFGVLVGKDTAYTQIKYKQSYLEILKGASVYNDNDKTNIPKFKYQDPSNAHLALLKKEFNLDSIAGKGNQISKFIHLMHWVHALVPHDGMHGNPDQRNALDMISICNKDNRGLNCRGLATVLNECYLSMGFKSRFVTCMPKDSIFNDCHVINMVYSDALNRWVWMDPTQDAYVMNEKGELLGLREVRERLINGKPMILNPDANWNKRVSATKENYLYNYMAKNLYRLECPISSEYNYETHMQGKELQYIQLLPLDAYKQTPKFIDSEDNESEMHYITYKTNNPNDFWAKPM